MLSPLIRRPRKNASNDAYSKQRGVTLALVAVSLVALIAMAALSIDVGTLYEAKAEAQRAADAAALTAARLISISGVTGDPNNTSSWQAVCGTGGTATLAAQAVAQSQPNLVGGAAPTAKVTYGPGAGVGDCSGLAGATSNFTVNPTVTVYVQQAKLPTFFARVFSLVGGASSNSGVSATAMAEVYNPSGSSSLASGMVPVQPRCVKPWIVPNRDPIHPTNTCTSATCYNFVQLLPPPANGTIPPASQGISLGGVGTGVIGEIFNLVPDCSYAGGACNSGLPFNATAQPNVVTTPPSATPNLQYLPSYVQNPSPAAPSCGAGNGDYQQSIAGCDNTTPYQCGVQSAVATAPTQVNLNENPYGAAGDTFTAAQCLIHEAGAGAGNGQDVLVTDPFPFQIQAGSANPLTGVPGGSTISSSDSIVSLPIYDSGVPLPAGQQPAVTIIGFLQVFINWVNADGSLNVTVLNVAGCGNLSTSASPYVTGTSPVPIRLITPP
jgi:Flp pilus assembly protein TadG